MPETITIKKELFEKMVEALDKITPKEFIIDSWWCPECQDWIGCATYTECCPNCGTYLADVQATNEWWKNANGVLKEAKEALK